MSGIERVTAGILSYNRRDDLLRTLEGVLSIDGLRIVVVDNGSRDGTLELLRDVLARHPERLRVQRMQENIGIAARNTMFTEIDTEFLLTLDDDSWPRSREDLLSMLRVMDSDKRIASVCASCVHPDTGREETAGIERFASGGAAESGFDVVNIAAGGTLLRMAAIRETEGYGKEFFWGREENDLAFQLIRKGWRVVYQPNAVVWHAMSPAGRAVYRRLQYVTRNSLWLLWKYFPLPVALPAALLFGVRRLLPCLKDVRRFPAVARGMAEGIAGLPRMRSRRVRFSVKESLHLRGWLLKLLYE